MLHTCTPIVGDTNRSIHAIGLRHARTSRVARRTCVVLAQFSSFSIIVPRSASRTSLAMAYLTCSHGFAEWWKSVAYLLPSQQQQSHGGGGKSTLPVIFHRRPYPQRHPNGMSTLLPQTVWRPDGALPRTPKVRVRSVKLFRPFLLRSTARVQTNWTFVLRQFMLKFMLKGHAQGNGIYKLPTHTHVFSIFSQDVKTMSHLPLD